MGQVYKPFWAKKIRLSWRGSSHNQLIWSEQRRKGPSWTLKGVTKNPGLFALARLAQFAPNSPHSDIHMKQVNPPILATKRGVRYWIRASEVPFFCTQKRTLLAISGCTKMGLLMPESKNGEHFLSTTILKMDGLNPCCSDKFWANFENCLF